MIKKWPAKISILILLLLVFPWPYAIYALGKIPACLSAAYYCYKNYKKDSGGQNKYFWHFLIIAILFNPILPVHLFFSFLWIIVDLATAFYFYTYLKNKL